MDTNVLKNVLKEYKLFVKESSKNFIIKCPFCGDHKDVRKQGHMYVSTDPNVPKAHCFYCGKSVLITTLIDSITGNKETSKKVITPEELNKTLKKTQTVQKFKERTQKYELPKIDFDSFLNKRLYIKKRSFNKMEPEDVPNLIFDFATFFRINNLEMTGEKGILSSAEYELLQNKFIGFLSRNHSIIFSRCIDDDSWFKFKKIPLQNDKLRMLDYWCINGPNPESDTIVLSEGNFNIICESSFDSLKIKDNVRLYAAGNSFSYQSLLQSVCYDEDLYKCKVIILSDDDKKPKDYFNFKNNNIHIIQSLEIWANKRGKDFGTCPIQPFMYKDTKFL